MDRVASEGWAVQVVDGEEMRQIVVTYRQIRRMRLMTASAVVSLIAVLAVLAVTLPRAWDYGEVVDENMALKGHIQELDDRMSEVDRILLRLRLYDAQLQSLSPDGDHGPLPPDAIAGDAHGAPLDFGDGPVVDPGDLRPAEAWASAVNARAEHFLQVFDETEPDLNALLSELEDLRALEEALPTTWPAHGQLTSGFGWRRSPFARHTDFHAGIDVADKRGSPIYAAGPGTVLRAKWSGGYGRLIEIDHGFGITSRYAHCTVLKVTAGDEVVRGQLIGTMGSSGRVTGPHLHFEVRIDGHPVDPLDYLPR